MVVKHHAGSIPALGIGPNKSPTKIMDEITEENPKRDEKKAFYVGLATILVLIIIIGFTFFLLRGCAETNNDLKKAQNNNENQTSKQSQTPASTPAQAEVAGTSTQPETTQATGQTYTVQSGDTLYDIGKKFKVDWRMIADANNIDNAGALKVGSQIIIPTP
jgi:cytoskeletal protein RodZ